VSTKKGGPCVTKSYALLLKRQETESGCLLAMNLFCLLWAARVLRAVQAD
jgi:hypothetical protein